MCPEPRIELYRHMDAANVDLKGFTEAFYAGTCAGHLQPVLETLEYLKHGTDVWFEITNLLIPGLNDSNEELDELTRWVVERLGPDVPLHFTAFHPDYKMLEVPPTPATTLSMARAIARESGLNYVYTGNVHDEAGASTYCPSCGVRVIGRDWHNITLWRLRDGRCSACGTEIVGAFEANPGDWGQRRMPVQISDTHMPATGS
jgi:pyruvate formate lyase activating enzyme